MDMHMDYILNEHLNFSFYITIPFLFIGLKNINLVNNYTNLLT